MKIGYIGLGIMGLPMSKNLAAKSGGQVYGFDFVKTQVDELVSHGGFDGKSSIDIAKECDFVFSMLPRSEHVASAYEEMLPFMHEGQIFIDMSTISPAVSRELSEKVRERGAQMLDAPVVKSLPDAIRGTLGIYVGGCKEAYEKALPLLKCLGENVIHLGANGAGLIMKICHNMLVAQIQNGVNEAITLAEKAGGIDVDTFVTAVSFGGGSNFYLTGKARAIASRDFATAFSTENMHKDVHLASDLADQAGIELNGLDNVVSRNDEAMEKGLGKKDFSSTIMLFD